MDLSFEFEFGKGLFGVREGFRFFNVCLLYCGKQIVHICSLYNCRCFPKDGSLISIFNKMELKENYYFLKLL